MLSTSKYEVGREGKYTGKRSHFFQILLIGEINLTFFCSYTNFWKQRSEKISKHCTKNEVFH